MAPTRDKWVRRFVITETSRHKRGFTIYKVTSLVFLKSSPDLASKVSVWKRYNDFKKLHKSLNNIYQRLAIKETFPPFPKGKYFSRFEIEVIKERRDCAIMLLEFISRHHSLATSEIFVEFFETSLQSDSCSTVSDCSESIGSDTSEESQMSPAASSYGIPPVGSTSVPQKVHKGHSDPLSPLLNLKSILNDKVSSNILERESPELNCIIEDKKTEDFEQYILIAAAHMSAGYRHESMNEHEEAFMQYKLGITNLLHGVQMDPDPVRQQRINEKIKKYADRAETLYNRYLNSNISLLSRPSDELKNYKVIKVVNSVMLVKDTRTNVERIIKTVEKVAGEGDDISHYILRGNIPFVVKLHGFVQTETTVFLILNYVRCGRLWEAVKKRYGVKYKEEKPKTGHVRSASDDDAVFRLKSSNHQLTKQPNKERNDFIKSFHVDNASKERDNHKENQDNSIYNKDLPTIELLEKAQELLKSVDATIRKSNSIADRLNEKHLTNSSSLGVNYFTPPDKNRVFNDESESELSVTDSSSGSFEKIDISEVSNDLTNYYEIKRMRIAGIEASEDSGVEMEQELWKIPENVVRHWTAQMIMTLEFFHRQNVIMKNLRPQNLLIDDNDSIVFCYVVPIKTEQFTVEFNVSYTAPELCHYLPEVKVTAAADVWSFGVILYELLTGMEFQTRHPGPYYSHSILSIPSDLSDDAKSLLRSILLFESSQRLTIKDIKHHSFYRRIDWETLGFNSKSVIGKMGV